MSAFVIGTETMDRVVNAICAKGRYGQIIERFAGVDTTAKDARTQIGRRLFTLNIEAVMQRYPDTENNPSDLPGEDGAARMPRTYKAKTRADGDLIAGYKAIQCLSYQCSEGDVLKTALYRELDAAAAVVAGAIIQDMPAYEAAPWD